MTGIRTRAIQLYDAFTHVHRDRRRLLREMAALAGSLAAAETLIATIAAAPAAAQMVAPGDPRLVTRKGGYAAGDEALTGYFAAPRNPGRRVGAVMVIHENRGLNAHIEDVARRLALAGYFAVAPDLLSFQGGTPADEDRARDLIAGIDYDHAIAACLGTIDRLHGLAHANGKVGAVGFCWGGGMINRLAVAAGDSLDAAVAYYGPAPDPAEAARVSAPLLLHYAGNDARVNATGAPWVEALKRAGKTVSAHVYPGVDHAFNNDTSQARYDAAAAQLAWQRTLDWFGENLG